MIRKLFELAVHCNSIQDLISFTLLCICIYGAVFIACKLFEIAVTKVCEKIIGKLDEA